MTKRSPSGWGRERSWQRRNFSASERNFILRRDRWVCYVCGLDGADQADHVIPLAEGGAHHTDNGRAIHATPCHEVKSREEAARGYARRRAQLKLPEEPHPFFVQEA